MICEIKAVVINPPMCAGVRANDLGRFAFDPADYVTSHYHYDSTDIKDVVLLINLVV